MKIADIQRATCEEFEITLPQMLSQRRTRTFSWPRHIAMGLCREIVKLSYPKIARAFKKEDHTTAIHGHRHYLELLKDGYWAPRIYRVEKKLNAQKNS